MLCQSHTFRAHLWLIRFCFFKIGERRLLPTRNHLKHKQIEYDCDVMIQMEPCLADENEEYKKSLNEWRAKK